MARKTERIDLRITPEQKTRLFEAAVVRGMTVSEFIRRAVGMAAAEANDLCPPDMKEVEKYDLSQ